MLTCNNITTGITTDDMQAYYDFHVKLMAVLNKSPKTYEAYNKREKEILEQPARRELLIKKDGLVIGWIGADAYESDNDRKLFAFSGHLMEEINDADFYKEVKQLITGWQKQFGATEGFLRAGNVYEENLRRFLQGSLLDEMRWCRLQVDKADENLLNRWIANADLTGLREVFSVAVPEEYMVQYVKGMNDGLKDIPTAMRPFTQFTSVEAEHRNIADRIKGNRSHLVLMLLNEKNELVGMTNLTIFSAPATPVRQWLTYVIPSLQGWGLAKYLKAKMMKHLLAGFKEVKIIDTDCYAGNAPMIEINRQMGYVYTKSTFDYRIGL